MIVHSYMVPIIYDSHLDNKRYVIADGKWTEVANNFKSSDIMWFKRPSKGEKMKH